MENLKRYKVAFRITFHCVGRKGLIIKNPYLFDYFLNQSEIILARNPQRAITIAKGKVTRQVNKIVSNQYPCILLTDSKSNFSPKVYAITGTNLELTSIIEIIL